MRTDEVFRVELLKPVEELLREALASSPPLETGDFLDPQLVELLPSQSTLRLDIRYATSENFLGAPVYHQARAFLQHAAAEALMRVVSQLEPLGYSLLIHDGYRPWYVTKMFWEGTPEDKRIFVANPDHGSRHNRGCAIDLTLYVLATGEPVLMPSGFDEMSPRSFVDYPGGTERQRWHRDLLRRAMEAEGFKVNPLEWWHFDHKDFASYRILNVPFEELESLKLIR